MSRRAPSKSPAPGAIPAAPSDAVDPSDGDMPFEIGPDAEFIEARQDLRRKARQKRAAPGEVEPVAAAEAALARMADSFDDWMADETQRLAELWAEADETDFEREAREAFHRAAHDIKGQAATLGFPLAGRIAGSLCRLLDGQVDETRIPRELVRQQIGRAVV